MSGSTWISRTLGRFGRDDGSPRPAGRSEEEWRSSLTPDQYRVLRQRGTERPFTAENVSAGADGLYRCAGCGAGLFAADTKFDSRTGWPSFFDAETDAVDLHRDLSMGVPRTEVICAACGGHLGHVFNDGPRRTGKRYCINGCALAADGA